MNRIELIVVPVSALLAGLVAYVVLFAVLRRLVDRSRTTVESSLVKNLDGPSRVVLPLTGLAIGIGAAGLPDPAGTILVHTVSIALVAAIAWLVVRATYVFDDVLLSRYQLDVEDNLQSRKVRTQILVLRRVTVVVVAVIALSVILLSFPQVRAAGAGLLASAGVIGILAGIAAKPTATNVVAGLQIALSQPIRVDDVVVVDGEWGRIEEIALTYVVVKVWDLRRLIVPISYFVEQPFENWTRSTADILGWVHVEVDYAAPIDAIRSEFEEIVGASPDWDGNVRVLQVTNLGSETMQLRALMSSPDSSRSWNLRCEVREKLVTFIQRQYPWALPRLRTVPSGESAGRIGEGVLVPGAGRDVDAGGALP